MSLSRAVCAIAFVGLSSTLIHCGAGTAAPIGNTDGGGGGGEGGHPSGVPLNHVTTAPACRTSRPVGTPGTDAGATDAGLSCPTGQSCCLSDADCTAGMNGRCLHVGNIASSECSYDTCFSDTDCGSGTTCACADPTSTAANSCVPSNCRTDADCGGGYCSPTQSTSCASTSGTVGFYCHTAQDECTNGSDCIAPGSNVGPAFCVYSTESAKWTCTYGVCAG